MIANEPLAATSKGPFTIEIAPGVQTNGRKEWQQIFGFPEVGCSIFYGSLGNSMNLGNILCVVPNITFNTLNPHWYAPRTSLGLGLAYFNKPYNRNTDSTNSYIGAPITAMAYVKVYLQTKLSDHLLITAGIMLSHCSDGHYQVPNVGLNMFSLFVGINYSTKIYPYHFEKRTLDVPKSKIKLNVRTGVGVHVLAQTLGPTGTPKYAIYSNDIYLSKRYGMVSNLHAGFEINQFNSYYNYIVANDYFSNQQKLKSTVVTCFIAHELMIGRFSILTQIGVNLYNPFYDNYINMYKSEQGIQTDLKKIFATRLGVHYYFFDPKYCTRNNIFIGAYVKANLGQADFICTQLGFVF